MSGTTAPTRSVGPQFKSQSEKPTATVSVEVGLDNVKVLAQTPQLIALLSYVSSAMHLSPVAGPPSSRLKAGQYDPEQRYR